MYRDHRGGIIGGRSLGQVELTYEYNVIAGRDCPSFPQRLATAEQLFRVISASDRADWITFVRQYDDGKGGWEHAILSADAAKIASNVVGNEDCRNTSSGGQKMADYFFRLAERYLSPVPQTTPGSVPAPDPRVTVTPTPTTSGSTVSTGGISPLLTVLFVVGLFAVTRGGRR